METTTVVKLSVTGWLIKITLAVAGLFLFILALQLLKDGAREYGRTIMTLLSVDTAASALGFGWLLAYIFLSGSPVAAIAVSFFSSGIISNIQAFTMITGSRLGASFIVLFVGFLYYLRGHQRAASVSIGVLALLTTAAIYIPALPIGYVILTNDLFGMPNVAADNPLTSLVDTIFDPVMNGIRRTGIPGWFEFVLGVGSLLLAFNLLDRALPEMHAGTTAFRRIGQLIYRPTAMFILGALVTSITMSVSVSLSILVPLSARGMVRRENTIPYIMGANITTFIDTLVAALVTGGPAAFLIVLVEMVSVAFLSILVLVFCYRWFERTLLRLQEIIIQTNTALGVFLCIMLVIPIVLLFAS
jgi:Na+/phosphate symporter